MGLRMQPRTLLTLFFILVFLYVLYEASNMPIQGKLYPWTIGLIAMALLIFQLVKEGLPTKREETVETGMDIDFTEEEGSKEGKFRALELFGWMYGFALLLWLIGFYLAIPLMVLAYMLRYRENLIMTIALPLATGVSTWFIFGHFLHLPFPPGFLLELFGLV